MPLRLSNIIPTTRELLADVVMQVTSDSSAFFFLGADQAARQILIPLGGHTVTLFALPQVRLDTAAALPLEEQPTDEG